MISGGMLERLKRGVCGQELNFSISSGFSTVNKGKHGESRPHRKADRKGRSVRQGFNMLNPYRRSHCLTWHRTRIKPPWVEVAVDTLRS